MKRIVRYASCPSEFAQVKEMVQTARNMCALPVSIKIRIDDDRRRTVELIRAVESAGVAWITVHGRTAKEFTKVPVHLDAIRLAKENATVPIVANGDCFGAADLVRIARETGADGVMSARGILANPALFAGERSVPAQCVADYVNLARAYGGSAPFQIHHNHLMYMLFANVSAADRAQFRQLQSLAACSDFLRARDMWAPSAFVPDLEKSALPGAMLPPASGVGCQAADPLHLESMVPPETDLAISRRGPPRRSLSILDPFADVLPGDARSPWESWQSANAIP